jgi:hypothetical protein
MRLRCRTTLSVALSALTLAPTRAAAQARDATARMEKLGDGVYAILHDHATLDWPSETMQ